MFPMGAFHVMLSTLIPAQYTLERIWSDTTKDTWFNVCNVFKRFYNIVLGVSNGYRMAIDNFLQSSFSAVDSLIW